MSPRFFVILAIFSACLPSYVSCQLSSQEPRLSGHRILCPAHHFEQIVNKWLHMITRHMTTTYLALTDYCFSLIASGKWRPIIWYKKINVTSFIFSATGDATKNVSATGDSFYLEILCPDWGIYRNYLY